MEEKHREANKVVWFSLVGNKRYSNIDDSERSFRRIKIHMRIDDAKDTSGKCKSKSLIDILL